MPELPEVETTLRGVAPHIVGKRVTNVVVRQWQLRWPVPADLPSALSGEQVLEAGRRGKYLLLKFQHGELIVHLGMSGSLRMVAVGSANKKHDHIDIEFETGQSLRLHDPRRFGAVLWTSVPAAEHPLLNHLGPEPLSEAFCAEYLFSRTRKRKQPIKTLIMDASVVVGVGNIYANEALFLSGIRPTKRAGLISRKQCVALVENIKQVLAQAIAVGGTTLRDFVGGDGEPGYFKQSLFVYGRDREPCLRCQSLLKLVRIGQRASVYCPQCQS